MREGQPRRRPISRGLEPFGGLAIAVFCASLSAFSANSASAQDESADEETSDGGDEDGVGDEELDPADQIPIDMGLPPDPEPDPEPAPETGPETAAEAGPAAEAEPAPPPAPRRRDCLDDTTPLDTSWCRNPRDTPGHVLICYEEIGDDLCPVVTPSHHVLSPNMPIRVIVRHRPVGRVAIALGGRRGLYTPVMDVRTQPSAEAAMRRTALEGMREPEPLTLSSALFGPRTPGEADLSITIERGEGELSVTYELSVQPTYSGAIRVGFGMVFGGAVDRAYEVRNLPGSMQPEIVATAGGDLDLELVVGFAPFLEALGSGRGYHDSANLTSFPFGFSPFVGVGLVGNTAQGPGFFTAFYFGLEWEPLRGFSIALTAVARRAKRLLPGLQVGDAASPGSVITSDAFRMGWGVVINISPDVFQVAGVF